ncbi:MAG TPA: zinc ribbon domain-containing protein [Planctomycetaceae bacterium]|nr:zinc ribbon domain-containing protein [Planctomycetaceae bacterium]
MVAVGPPHYATLAMPIFEYRCQDCRQDFELLVRASDVVECPHCRSKQLEKLFSTPAAPVTNGSALPIASGCAPSGPPCSPTCCRLPQG